MFEQRRRLIKQLTQTLAYHRISLDPPDAFYLLMQMVNSLEQKLHMPLDNGSLTGLLLHLFWSRMPENQKKMWVKQEARLYIEQTFPYELSVCLQAIRTLNQQFLLPLSEDEAYNVLGILMQVDIFIDIGAWSLRLSTNPSLVERTC
jgi:transcriptional regulatory protein LevR